jgi:hypothetical protein
MILKYARLAIAFAAFGTALTYGFLQWQDSGLRFTLHKRQREVESKASLAAATRIQLQSLEGKLSVLRSLTQEIGPAVAGDIIYRAEERRNAVLLELVQKHQLRMGSDGKGRP